ncbi:translation initiation factor IF-1 [Candidatus Saccharibacteria bacterium]|nr:translation initiation factor IF-1 [Candidatus Saccharibacteria bacterium]
MSKAKTDLIELDAKVVEVLPNGLYIVEVDQGHRIKAHVSGKMRINWIRIQQGDRVKIELSTYDLEKGRITYRYR